MIVTAKVEYPEAGKACTAYWYIDGKLVDTQDIVLGTDVPKLTHAYTLHRGHGPLLPDSVRSHLHHRGWPRPAGHRGTHHHPENYDYLYYHGITEEELLNMVTSQYAGNYTLAWAQNHDYPEEIKTAWVNLKGYQSNSKYLVWVNLTYQRVNIFEGSQGHWKLIRTCLCGSGTNATPTIRGVFTTSYKQTAWDYGSYYCGPIVRFYGTSGYAFHSRLQYWPMNPTGTTMPGSASP